MSNSDKTSVLNPGEGQVVLVPGHKITLKLFGEDNDLAYSLLEVELDGVGPPQHIHNGEDEVLYVLEGEIKVLLGRRTIIAKAGTSVCIPRGTVHAFCRIDKKPAKVLAIFSPAGFEKFFHEAVDLDVLNTEAYVAKCKALAKKYHMEIVGPPLDA